MMKKIYLILFAVVLLMFTACETDILNTTIVEGTAPVATASNSTIALSNADSANVALTVNWTDPQYLEETSNGNVIGTYLLEVSKSEAFDVNKSYTIVNELEKSFTVFALNKILLDLEYEPDIASATYIRVKSIFFTEDTLSSNTLDITVTPFTTVIPPAISVPSELYIIGGATLAEWGDVSSQQLTQVSDTKFEITIDLIGNSEYALITDPTGSNWSPCFRLDPTVDAASAAMGGTFVWDGEGSDYGWTSINFLSPEDDGTYQLIFDFQEATYTVINASGPPAIEVPNELWISSDGLEGGWITPFPAERQFEKVSDTKFTISIFIAAGNEYEMITDGSGENWTPCYRIDPLLDPAEMIWEGSFVWDGEGSDYSWGSKKFMSPPDDGVYKITMNFQTATFVVEEE